MGNGGKVTITEKTWGPNNMIRLLGIFGTITVTLLLAPAFAADAPRKAKYENAGRGGC